MHSPVAHVLYLCHPEMKHLCGDGFLLRNLIKVLKNKKDYVFLISFYANTVWLGKLQGRIRCLIQTHTNQTPN